MNAVTGETGAGKSLLQRALAIAVGHRVGAEVIRAGADAARVEAAFELPADDALAQRLRSIGVEAAAGCELRVRRSVARSGRGQVALNDRVVSLATLADVASALLHLQGQHESLRLAQPETHLAMLDEASGTRAELAAYRAAWAVASDLVARLEALERGAAENERRLEIARFDLDELVRAALSDPDEEAALAQERVRLRNVERLAAVAAEALERLHGGEAAALAAVESAARRLADAGAIDGALARVAEALDEAAAPLAE